MAIRRSLLALIALVAVAACGGADNTNDPDRTSLAAREPHSVMWFDSTKAVIPGEGAGAKGGTANGAEVFTRCAVCHQQTGLGMPGAYPPLAGSEWLLNNPEVPIRIVLHGLQGPITVKGSSFNNAMTPFGDQLSDAEIAAVISYERSSWGNSAPAITAAQVASVRTGTKAQTTAWNPKDLQGLIHGK
ncbi:MAG TPA: cytochrome c [Gemmatimonadaceae bacterium]|jgi:mono/diheme cytochrome c family protein|nr:cytochrome c [Gemmatimonadaceae bacterium]